MSGAGSAVEHHHRHHVTLPKMERNPNRNPNQTDCCNPVKKPGPVSIDHVLLALRETKEERDVRIRTLFIYFDAANLGYLDYAQIEAGLSGLQIPAGYKYAKELLEVCDANRDGRVDYQDFRRYMDDKEMELYRIFQAIDVEHNGCILPEELWDALVKAGIEIDEEELARFVEHVDKDNNGIITFEEWRDFLLLYPHEATIENIYHHWERVCHVDIGEQAVIPEGISKHVHRSKYFIAGGIAGAASRSATAPLDRLKVVLQVQTTRACMVPAISKIWKEEGFLGFFRGNGLNVLKVAPESAIKFYAYEMLKNAIGEVKGGDKVDIGPGGRLLAGGMAGAVAQTAIYPLDLVKTRLQTYVCEGGKAPPKAYPGCLCKARRTEHHNGFTRPRILFCQQQDNDNEPQHQIARREIVLRSSELAVAGAIFNLGGKKPDYLGVQKNQPSLSLCPATKNCISTSENITDLTHYAPPWNYNGGRKKPVSKEKAMEELLDVIRSTKPEKFTPKIVERDDDYVHVEYQSPILGLVDDVEFWFRPGNNAIVEYRSASRLGNFDFDYNRKRIKILRLELEKKGWASAESF